MRLSWSFCSSTGEVWRPVPQHQLLGLGLGERNLVHERRRHTMGADFIVPFREESKERARKALFHWCLTVLCFLQQLCYEIPQAEMCEVLRGTGNCCSTPLGLVLSVRCSPLNFCELGLSKSLYYPKAPGAYFLVSIHRIIGMHVCPTVTVQLYCMLLGRSGILDWNNCLP